jgi:predicted PurR-regulated permease PerM
MKNKRGLVVVAVFIIFITVFSISPPVTYAESDQNLSKIQSANTAIEQAFTTIQKLEQTGANITKLVNKLNTALDLLTQAEYAYEKGDTSLIIQNSDAATQIAQQVTSEAQITKNSAVEQGFTIFCFSIVAVVGGIFFFLYLMLLVWRRFNRRYFRDLSQTKPEVSNYESWTE